MKLNEHESKALKAIYHNIYEAMDKLEDIRPGGGFEAEKPKEPILKDRVKSYINNVCAQHYIREDTTKALLRDIVDYGINKGYAHGSPSPMENLKAHIYKELGIE